MTNNSNMNDTSTINSVGTVTLTASNTYYTNNTYPGIGNINLGNIKTTYPALEIKGDIMLDGVSLKETLNKITERLCILVPDPDKLERYKALQDLYEQYKVIEALLK